MPSIPPEGNVVNLEGRSRHAPRELYSPDGSAPSEDAMALGFVARYGREYRYVAPWHRWIRWEGKRWVPDSTGHVFALIRAMVREVVGGTRHERRIATAAYVAGVERLARYDQSIVVVPADLDADPWLLNTQAGIVDLRAGIVTPHDSAALMTRLRPPPRSSTRGPSSGRVSLLTSPRATPSFPPICSGSPDTAPPA